VSLDKGLGYEVDKRSTVDETKGREEGFGVLPEF
jgi:hypothetical protein